MFRDMPIANKGEEVKRIEGFIRIYNINRSHGFGVFTSARYAAYQLKKG
jgi:hypothetical protein